MVRERRFAFNEIMKRGNGEPGDVSLSADSVGDMNIFYCCLEICIYKYVCVILGTQIVGKRTRATICSFY
jgi:hypothetical protein